MASSIPRRDLYAGVVAGLAVLTAAAVSSAAPASAAPASAAPARAAAAPAAVFSRLSADPLGINVGPWDYAYSKASSGAVLQSLLKAAGIRQLRFGGGGSADAYDWQTNTTIEGCLPDNPTASFTSSCAAAEPLSFSQFSQRARAIGAASVVTVNYGSGTPAEAAAWVRQAARSPAEAVALWEVGNEDYGCWEVNNELAGPPEYYQHYTPGIHNAEGQNPTCPMVTQGTAAGMQTMATSYAKNAEKFLAAMKAADSRAVIGVPWAFGSDVPGAWVPDGYLWNNTVLKTDGKYAGFVDAHYYPYGYSGSSGGSNPSVQEVLGSLWRVESLYRGIRVELNMYDPKAAVVVGETGVSNQPTTTTCTPAGALFAAGDVLSWLAAGAQSVDWWDLDNYDNTGSRCVHPDEGMFSSPARPIANTPYWGYLLAAVLAQPHAVLGTLPASDPSVVLAFQALLPDGHRAVALINTDTSHAERVTFKLKLSGTLQTWRYSAGNQNASQSKIVQGRASAASVAAGVTLAAESVTILRT